MKARLLCAVLLALPAGSGCTSEAEEPGSLPPLSPRPSASALPTAEVPPSAQAETPQGAAAFARFFYAEVERAFAEKDPEIVRRLSAPGCESCRRFVESIASLRELGERVSPVNFKLLFAEAPAFTGQEARVDVVYNLAAVDRLDAKGRVVFQEPAAEGREIRMTLVRGGSGWLVKAAEAV